MEDNNFLVGDKVVIGTSIREDGEIKHQFFTMTGPAYVVEYDDGTAETADHDDIILAPEDFVAPVVGFKYATIEILREKETIFDSPTSGKYFVREWTVTDGEREERSGTFFKTMNEAENYVNEYQS